MGMYYDNRLVGVKSVSLPVKGTRTTSTITTGFDSFPSGEKKNVSVKIYAFLGDEAQFTDKIDIISKDNRAVEPVMFGNNLPDHKEVIVAFMGDSITHLNPSYAKWIEYYYRIKYPLKNIRFVNKGISGDSAGGNESRFYWDILEDPNTGRPTEACIMIGMNDVNRRLYANDENGNDVGTEDKKQAAISGCLQNISDIADLCEKENVKLTLITPSIYDEYDYTSSENMDGANGALIKLSEGIRELANKRNLAYIDFNGPMNTYNAKLRKDGLAAGATIFNVSDRIHATADGTFMAGYLFITQQLGTSPIATAYIDVNTLSELTENAVVANVFYEDGTLSYTYAPDSLPMYMTSEYLSLEQNYGIPVTDSINREIIKVSGLEEGKYKIMFGDALIGTYSSEELSQGVNIATNKANPGYVQSKEVYDLVCKKLTQENLLRNIAYVERYVAGNADLTDVDACVDYINKNYADSTDSTINRYASVKPMQEMTVDFIEKYEIEAMNAARPGVYEVKIIKQ